MICWSFQLTWNPWPQLSVSARRIVSARIWRCTLPYLSFLRIARAASPVPCGPWMLIDSTSSGTPSSELSSYRSELSTSIQSVMDECGFSPENADTSDLPVRK